MSEEITPYTDETPAVHEYRQLVRKALKHQLQLWEALTDIENHLETASDTIPSIIRDAAVMLNDSTEIANGMVTELMKYILNELAETNADENTTIQKISEEISKTASGV
jgi:hypothetical protein